MLRLKKVLAVLLLVGAPLGAGCGTSEAGPRPAVATEPADAARADSTELGKDHVDPKYGK